MSNKNTYCCAIPECEQSEVYIPCCHYCGKRDRCKKACLNTPDRCGQLMIVDSGYYEWKRREDALLLGPDAKGDQEGD